MIDDQGFDDIDVGCLQPFPVIPILFGDNFGVFLIDASTGPSFIPVAFPDFFLNLSAPYFVNSDALPDQCVVSDIRLRKRSKESSQNALIDSQYFDSDNAQYIIAIKSNFQQKLR